MQRSTTLCLSARRTACPSRRQLHRVSSQTFVMRQYRESHRRYGRSRACSVAPRYGSPRSVVASLFGRLPVPVLGGKVSALELDTGRSVPGRSATSELSKPKDARLRRDGVRSTSHRGIRRRRRRQLNTGRTFAAVHRRGSCRAYSWRYFRPDRVPRVPQQVVATRGKERRLSAPVVFLNDDHAQTKFSAPKTSSITSRTWCTFSSEICTNTLPARRQQLARDEQPVAQVRQVRVQPELPGVAVRLAPSPARGSCRRRRCA